MKGLNTFILSLAIWFYTGAELFAQNSSPFIYQMPYFNNLQKSNSICIFNDSIYFSNDYFNTTDWWAETVIVARDLDTGRMIAKVLYAGDGNLFTFRNKLIFSANANDYKHALNSSISLRDKLGVSKNPIIIGDSANVYYDIISVNNNMLIAGYYNGKPENNFSSNDFGFLALYTLDGSKIWEKYYRLNIHNYKTLFFDKAFVTKDNKILIIGHSQWDTTGSHHRRVVTVMLDTNGNVEQTYSPLDSFGINYSSVLNRLVYSTFLYYSFGQVNDSTYCAYYLDVQISAPGYWIFFNHKGEMLYYRKAWYAKDSINDIRYFNKPITNLAKKKDGTGFYAIAKGFYGGYKNAFISLDNEMYLQKAEPYLPVLNHNSVHVRIEAFIEDEDKSVYTLNSLSIDSLSDNYIGAMVCKLDSNGVLLSNGKLKLKTGIETQQFSGSNFYLFPNPAKETFSIKTNSSKVYKLQILTTSGTLIEDKSFSIETSCDLSAVPAQLLLIIISNGEGEYKTFKLVHTE